MTRNLAMDFCNDLRNGTTSDADWAVGAAALPVLRVLAHYNYPEFVLYADETGLPIVPHPAIPSAMGPLWGEKRANTESLSFSVENPPGKFGLLFYSGPIFATQMIRRGGGGIMASITHLVRRIG